MKKNPTFGEFIRLTRKKKRGMPLISLSKKLGISPAQLQRIEENKIRVYPDEKFLEKLCKALEIDYETLVDLLYHHKKKKKQDTTSNINIPIVPWEFLTNLQNINPETIASSFYPSCNNLDNSHVGIYCNTEEWQPHIYKNDLIFLRLTQEIKNNDTVIISDSQDHYHLKKIIQYEGKLLLLPFSLIISNTSAFTDDINTKIVGTVSKIIREF